MNQRKEYDTPYKWPFDADANPIVECKYCRVNIYWRESKKGKPCPIDAGTHFFHTREECDKIQGK